ncbi:MAG TPA: deoxynucleoside kinase [Candidatus Marinimicrobia bacterium]|nr:deoxynucleoside kinase [Candidatus Neomarinimicrobiota bacterium]HIB71565.1 deoxynucleoside kinase [Candidatus Neomarinimicrobiota bacterium]HIB95758.1 deoxynucleoside kinase [Candidatus Neomarinimicrobiota bacterium]HIN61402.1 deoxynucleoside kinase [Candidatus Neomarinimicrobiota bacterium]HIO35723.1 deoxynucleoside kinase [Candidatus Neomarinimicrobiota bacterium]
MYRSFPCPAIFSGDCVKNLYYVSIEGVIGVGKTSLAHLLEERLNAKLVMEKFDENPFLADFYLDPERYAFQTQLFFLLSRYRQQQELRQTDVFHKLVISDYMFVKDRLFASLNLDDKEMSLYDSVAKILEKNILNPDLVIYLQAETPKLMERITLRGRDFEKNMSQDYIDALNQVYNEYFFRFQESPLLIINTNDIDFVHNEEDLEEVIRYIRQPVSGTKFFNPASNL